MRNVVMLSVAGLLLSSQIALAAVAPNSSGPGTTTGITPGLPTNTGAQQASQKAQNGKFPLPVAPNPLNQVVLSSDGKARVWWNGTAFVLRYNGVNVMSINGTTGNMIVKGTVTASGTP